MVLSKVIPVPFLRQKPWQNPCHFKTTRAQAQKDRHSSTNYLLDSLDWEDHFSLQVKTLLAGVIIANIFSVSQPSSSRNIYPTQLHIYSLSKPQQLLLLRNSNLHISNSLAFLGGGGEGKLVLAILDIRKNNHAIVYSKVSNQSVFIILFSQQRDVREMLLLTKAWCPRTTGNSS